jgi:hypothetical protein
VVSQQVGSQVQSSSLKTDVLDAWLQLDPMLPYKGLRAPKYPRAHWTNNRWGQGKGFLKDKLSVSLSTAEYKESRDENITGNDWRKG